MSKYDEYETSRKRVVRLLDSRSNPDSTPVVGTYLWPVRYFGAPNPNDPYEAVRVITAITIDGTEVLVTRLGGLFVRDHTAGQGADFAKPGIPENEIEKSMRTAVDFQDAAISRFNQLICELCLRGIVSEPSSPVHLAPGVLYDDHALISGGGGSREMYTERTMFPTIPLVGPPINHWRWLTLPLTQESELEAARDLGRTRRLTEIGDTLPLFVAGAYANFSQRQLAEGMSDAFIVAEQLLDYLWVGYLETIVDAARRKRLKDDKGRTYTAAVRSEILLAEGVLPEDVYRSFTAARQHRNKLAHRARVSDDAASFCAEGMRAMLQLVLGTSVEPAFFRGRSITSIGGWWSDR